MNMDYWIKICDLKMALNNGILKFNILFFQMKYSVNITVTSFFQSCSYLLGDFTSLMSKNR